MRILHDSTPTSTMNDPSYDRHQRAPAERRVNASYGHNLRENYNHKAPPGGAATGAQEGEGEDNAEDDLHDPWHVPYSDFDDDFKSPFSHPWRVHHFRPHPDTFAIFNTPDIPPRWNIYSHPYPLDPHPPIRHQVATSSPRPHPNPTPMPHITHILHAEQGAPRGDPPPTLPLLTDAPILQLPASLVIDHLFSPCHGPSASEVEVLVQ
eukprot:jgi/Tetstr1/456697/TSEL_043398.t1